MGFNGATVLSPLDYTGMEAYGIPDGTIPEPTNEAMVAFLEAIQAMAKAPEDGTVSGIETLATARQTTADLCSGTPSAEQLAKLPPRLFREFMKWLASEFLDPKD